MADDDPCPRVTPEAIEQALSQARDLVINITAQWCPDCTEQQRPRLPGIVERLAAGGLPVWELCAQRDKHEYIGDAHRRLVERCGGHGFPRTVLVLKGNIVDADNVEVITEEALDALAERFLNQYRSG